MESRKDVTIYDIAKHLGVSTATISRAIKNHPGVSKKTQKKVEEAIKELGYRYNTFASSLRMQKTNTIGIMVPEINSNFMTSVLAGIEKVTAEAGYDILITHSAESSRREAANALNLFHKRVDGVIASLASDTKDLNHFSNFEEKKIPVVFFDRVEEQSNSTKVIIDNYQGGYDVTRHLIDQGCKRILIATGSLQRNVYARRYQGYRDALLHAGIPAREELQIVKVMNEESGQEIARHIIAMKERPDGVFVANDSAAAICMEYLKEAGIKIPEDIAIAGFNNDSISRITAPHLTTVDYPGKDMGEVAARTLINHLQGISQLTQMQTIIIRSRLIIRKSSLRFQ